MQSVSRAAALWCLLGGARLRKEETQANKSGQQTSGDDSVVRLYVHSDLSTTSLRGQSSCNGLPHTALRWAVSLTLKSQVAHYRNDQMRGTIWIVIDSLPRGDGIARLTTTVIVAIK